MEQYILFDELPRKVERAVQMFQMFEDAAVKYHKDGYYLAFSGGKDSVVLYTLAKMAHVKFQAHYHLTTVDPPELVRFIRNEYPSVVFEYPELTMWDLIVKKQIPPTRKVRYCCDIFYRKKVLMERNRENSCFYRTFPLFSFHNTFITSVQDLSAKTKGHRFFAMMLFHLLKFLCLLFQKLPVSFLHRLWHKPLLW